MPNKTFKLKFPNINEKYYLHFIRGLIDGDGCIFNRSEKYLTIDMISTYNVLEKISNIVYPITNLKPKIRNHGKSYRIIYTGKRALKLGFNLLIDAELFLYRKWMHIFKLRTASGAHPQMKALMNDLLKQFKERIPIIFDEL